MNNQNKKESIKNISTKIHQKLKKQGIKKYSKRELKLLNIMTFETIKEIILENPEGVLITNFGSFKIKNSFYRDTFGTKEIREKKKVSFNVSKNFSRKINKKK